MYVIVDWTLEYQLHEHDQSLDVAEETDMFHRPRFRAHNQYLPRFSTTYVVGEGEGIEEGFRDLFAAWQFAMMIAQIIMKHALRDSHHPLQRRGSTETTAVGTMMIGIFANLGMRQRGTLHFIVFGAIRAVWCT